MLDGKKEEENVSFAGHGKKTSITWMDEKSGQVKKQEKFLCNHDKQETLF